MNLQDLLPKNLPFFKPTKDVEYFFALNIGNRDLTASIWGILGKSLRIINTVKLPIAGDDDLVEAGNRLLDEVLGDFQPEPEKILFGVPDSWLQDENLKETHLNFLKHLTKELDVEPIAFVSTSHAVSHLLQKQTGVPTTAILVDITDPLNVTLVKGGKVIGSRSVKRSEDLPIDIEKALHSFTDVEVLPSKIVLYGQGDLNKLKDEILSFNWMSNLPFLHLPKIDILEDGIEIRAISLAGAAEIDPDVNLPHHGMDATLRSTNPTHKMNTHQRNPAPNAGFVAGDIERVSEEKEREILEGQPPLRGQNPAAVSPRQELYPQRYPNVSGVKKVRESQLAAIFGRMLDKPLAFLRSKGINLKLPGGRSGRMVVLPVIVLILLLAGYLFLAKATVTIYVDPKILEKDAQVIADPAVTTVDENQKIIPGKIVETDIEGSQKGNATGTKQIGDPSRGKVVIYNKTATSSALSQGTVFQDGSGHSFTLDSDTGTIPAVAGEDSPNPGSWGQVSANITASQIGPDSNLPANAILSIKNQASSVVSAKVDTSGLTGGTSKNVTVVTSNDQKTLLAALASSLRSQAQSKLQAKLSGDEKILSEALDEKIANTSYSKKVGDQASDFSLDLTIHYKGTAYSDKDLKSMVSKLVQTNVPPGFELRLADTTTQADVSKLQPDGKLIFLARFKANLIPKLDTDSIKSSIKGKSSSQAADIIKNIDNVIGSDIVFQPNLPGPLRMVPFLSSNINIVVTTK